MGIQLSCENITIAYEKNIVVKNISFQIEQGDYMCILGENGAGKSTLLKGILGLVPLVDGTVLLEGDMKKIDIGYLPQQTQIQKDFPASVYEVVLSGCLNQKGKSFFYHAKEKERAEYNLKRLGIEELKKKSYRNLSGGQQQRVLLARALCATDKIIFLDEPISGLDPVVTTEFYQLIERINREDNISVVMISHDINTALKSADKILHIKKEEAFFGTKAEYLKSDFGREFIQNIEK